MAKLVIPDRIWPKLRTIARREGLAALAGARLPTPALGLPSAFSLAVQLSDEIVREVAANRSPTMAYYHHYRTANALLDRAAFLVARALSDDGFRAFPIPASQTADCQAQAGAFPHKTAAVAAGLGWIGRHALLVTDKHGPRVRLATVLTDMPLPEPADNPTQSRCGSCQACVAACPAKAIHGAPWTPGTPREMLVDVQACLRHMRDHFDRVGRGAVCGVCMAVCPGEPGARMEHIPPTPRP